MAELFDRPHLEVLSVFAAQASLLVRNALLVNELKLDNRSLQSRIEQIRFGEILGSGAADAGDLPQGPEGGGHRHLGADHRRDRDRQGADRARAPQPASRAKQPFVTINCGAIPENLLESELFGHVRGAFTGAVGNKVGRFQSADRGTLFLDEMGEMPLALQVKILRALQEKVVVRVGETRAETIDIRVIAATNRDLEVEMKAGRFREDSTTG